MPNSVNAASSILIPSGLAQVHPQLETCIKSIKSAVAALNGVTSSNAGQAGNLAGLQGALEELQSEVAALQETVGSFNAPTVYKAGTAIAAYLAIYEMSSGIAGIASSTSAATSAGIIGITINVAAPGLTVSYAGPGETVSNPAWSFAVGPVFLGAGGVLTQAIPINSFPVQIGNAISATSVLVDIQGPFVPLLNATSDPSAVALYVNSGDGTLRYYNGASWVHLGAPRQLNCAWATAAALPANSYSNGSAGVGATLTANANGALTVDGATAVSGYRVLVMNEAVAAHNGVYVITQAGSTSAPYILTRATDANEANQLGPGLLVPVNAPNGLAGGALNNGIIFISSGPIPFVQGTSDITFAPLYTADGTTITLTGTELGLTPIVNKDLLANISGATAKPGPTTLTALLDAVFGTSEGALIYRGATAWSALGPGASGQVLETLGAAPPSWTGLSVLLDTAFGATQGSILYRGAAAWAELVPGTSGQFLETQGVGANPQWATSTGLPSIANNDLLANTSGASAVPMGITLTALLDAVFGTMQGAILYRGAGSWAELAPGSSGEFLQTLGSGANPAWSNATGSGSVITSGLYASLPAAPLGGQLYKCTDVPADLIYQGGAWQVFHRDTLVSPVNSASFSSWYNQSSTTKSASGPFTFLTCPQGSIGTSLNYKAVPATPYTWTVGFKLNTLGVQFGNSGIALFETSNNESVAFFVQGEGTAGSASPPYFTLNAAKFTSGPTFSANYLAEGAPLFGDTIWLQIQDNGTNRSFWYSVDSVEFVEFYSVGRTDFIAPTSIGFWITPPSVSGNSTNMYIVHSNQ